MTELPDDPGLPDSIDFGPPPAGYEIMPIADGDGGNPDKIKFRAPSGVTLTLTEMWAKGLIEGGGDDDE